MSQAHHRAAAVLAEYVGTQPTAVEAQLTFGPTVVVTARLDTGSAVFIKAGSNQNVHTEAAVIEHARTAGVPTVEVIDIGTDDQLPGRRWLITRAATGRKLIDVGRQTPTTARTLDDLAECYTRLHRVALPGFGPIAEAGRHGVLDSWSQWQRQTIDEALSALVRSGAVSAALASRVRELCDAYAKDLDDAPAALLHADLGDGETFVDPADGAVTAIVDWGSALVGDPLYDLARFVGGGPADDERPGQLLPTLHARYFERNAYDREHTQRMLTFYRFHICVVEAAWGEDIGWTPGLLAWAERLIDVLET